ncbi:MAG TPA: glycosyltransferase, partial [Allocoleopsis sp.]
FAEANLADFEYWIVGEGPEKARLQALAAKLGIADRVKFWSRLPRQEILHKLGECLALLHPSLHDSGGWVCLEAMAAGCPVICLDLGGPALQVTEETGFKIAARSPDQTVQDLAKAMTHLAKDQDLRVQMGEAAQKHVWSSFSWEKRGQLLVDFYEEVLKQQAILSHSSPSSV